MAAEPPSIARRDLAVLGALLALAAVLRFIGLPGRGTWDADQGHDMLVLLGLVRDGTVPLLGPPTSIGAFHHGALYYYLLAPAAFVSAAGPTAVVAEIALAGVAAVGVTWWLARSIGGPVAGLVAGLVMAVSGSAIDESTFIWNPNLIALGSAIALASAWRAWTTDRARWWLLAAVGLLITMQCHVLGVALVPPVAGLWALSWRRTPDLAARRRIGRAGLAGLAIILVGYLPLLVHELGHDFSESRAAIAFIASGGTGVGLSLPARLLFVAFRILAWPLTGLLTDGLAIGVGTGVVVAAALVWRAVAASGRERTAARWFAATLLFGWIALTFGAAGLATVTPLPVDHYHAFLDPVVYIALGLGAAAVWRHLGGPLRAGRIAVAAGVALLLIWNVSVWPRAVASDGGWPTGRLAGDRIEATVGARAIRFVGLPSFKSTEAYAFPLVRDGRTVSGGGTYDALAVANATHDGAVVIVCDTLFVADCGGTAEEAALASGSAGGGDPQQLRLADRFSAAPGRTISVYLPQP
jgi:4-amino-4-deoxy-L-arabinose transferase-like glycosyltransferase